jgi:hypothetical protein
MFLTCYSNKAGFQLGRIVAAAVVSTGLLLPLRSQAGSYFYQFTDVFYGATPTSSSPWVDAFFTDMGAGVVQIKISADGLTGSEFLGGLYLNLDPSLNPKQLSFSVVGEGGSFALPTISTGEDKFKANGDGKYDILLKFNQKAAKSFNANDYVIFDVSSSAGPLVASDFDFVSKAAGGSGPFLAALEIDGIASSCNTTTGWIAPCQFTPMPPVPEPAPAAMLGVALSLWAGLRWLTVRSRKA